MAEQTTAAAKEQTGAVAGTVKDEAGAVASTAVVAGGEVAAHAKDQASQVVGETVRQARDLAGEVRQQVSGQVSGQTQQLSGKVRSLAEELSGMAANSDQSGLGAEVVRQVADRAHGLAGYLENRQPTDLLDDLRNLARRRPGGFLAGSALAGILAGRLTRGVKDASSADSGPAQLPAPSAYPQRSSTGYSTDVRGPAGTATGAPTAGLGGATGTGLAAGYPESAYPSTSYRDPLADDSPLYEDPTVAAHRPDVSGI